jgi:hypothetical protein
VIDLSELNIASAAWRKSSRTGSEGNCVEVAPVWRKSSQSGPEDQCVELTHLAQVIAVRDSKNPNGPRLIITRQSWRTFSVQVKSGSYDLN